ncbi:hypothetical protein B5F79_10735 [Olsenella sp. An285]|uniref:S-layer homology domain-containing protein n=1 Tax=Olsenella sp. An285 TaxID=1965621 RepID=UPI000B39E263|nr:S-layer homology domain-containing protein [Olsenella sp. An285]OUO44906.1 hypothetical protein B5F79_10735 [Olsenella sp. An285]
MTACRNKASRAVTAALVGVLSVGAVPMVAMAATTDAGAQLQAVSPAQAFSDGALTYAHDNQGYRIDDLTDIEFTVGSDCFYPMPLQVTPKNADEPVDVSNWDVNYYNADGDVPMDPGKIRNWTAGKYYMLIKAPQGSGYEGGVLRVDFRIVSKSLKSLTIFDQSEGDVSDTTFTYTGEEQQIGFMLDGKVLDKPTDFFRITYVNAADSTPVRGVPTDAGDYVARLEGKGEYKYSRVEIAFTINPLDLSTASVTMSDISKFEVGKGMPQEAVVNGVTLDEKDLDIEFAGSSNEGDLSLLNFGTYTASVAADPASGNVTGATEATFSVVDKVVNADDLLFKGKKVGNVRNDPYYVLLEDLKNTAFGDDDFSVDQLAWTWWGDLIVKYPGAKLSVTYTDANGNQVTAKDVNTTVGDYKVTVRVDATSNEYNYGSDAVTMTIRTRKDAIKANADLYFKLDGAVTDDRDEWGWAPEHVTYTGENILDRIDTVLEYRGEALTAGTDYNVTVYRYDGFDDRIFKTAVDSVTDAGLYQVVVSSGDYMLEFPDQDLDFWFYVDPIKLEKVYVGSDAVKTFSDQSFIPYTGKAADYYFYYMNGDEVVRLDDVIELSHFYFTPEGGQTTDADAIVDCGEYYASIYLADGVKNYDLCVYNTFNTPHVFVKVANIFADVAAGDWYAEPVYAAKTLGYMTGYDDGTFFGPADSIKRGDVAMVLWKMAGRPEVDEFGDSYDETTGFVTGFSDVDGNLYYAEAIAWAHRLDIISGDDNATTFRPDDNVTREELAKMLYVYSKLQDKTYDVDVDAVLSEYDDESTVSEWAREYVAWCVDMDVMGQDSGLKGNQAISRAEVATMAVRLQPEGKLSPSDFIK